MVKFEPVSKKGAISFACKIYSGRIGWKNTCKMWLEGHTPEQLKGEER